MKTVKLLIYMVVGYAFFFIPVVFAFKSARVCRTSFWEALAWEWRTWKNLLREAAK